MRKLNCLNNFYIEAVVMQRHKRATVNATVVYSIPIRRSDIFNIFISSLW